MPSPLWALVEWTDGVGDYRLTNTLMVALEIRRNRKEVKPRMDRGPSGRRVEI